MDLAVQVLGVGATGSLPELQSPEQQRAAAVKLYELGRLSSGAAASIAGIPRVAFLEKLADFGVPAIKHTAEELKRDFENA